MKLPTLFRILYVVNDTDDCTMLQRLIDSPYMEIIPTESVINALARVQTEDFNLYLLETRLPDGDGFELCRQIRKLRPETPVVFYTGDAHKAFIEKGLASGANLYFIKPYFNALILMISQMINSGYAKFKT